MCIIAIKPAGVDMPDKETISNCWDNNPDGAGIMYPANGQVRIEKGFMTLKSLLKRLRILDREIDLENTTLVLHFRIGTAGGNTPQNTHPFPITGELADLRKLDIDCGVGMVHNGIIAITPHLPDISDTMEYILSQLSILQRMFPEFYKDKDAMELIANQVQSKLAFLTPDGAYYTIGKFNDEDGILYSNYGYIAWEPELSYPKVSTKQNPYWYSPYDLYRKHTHRAKNYADSYVYLVWLNSETEYIQRDGGDLDDADGWLTSEYGELYIYDRESKGVYAIEGAHMVPTCQEHTVYDREESELFQIYG